MVRNRGQAFCARTGSVLRGLATAISLVGGAELAAYSAAAHVPILIGFLGLFPLFVTLRVYRVRVAVLCGATWGVCLYAQLATWHVIDRTAWTALVFAIAPACHAGLGALLTRWVGFSPLVLGVAWFGVEFALSISGLPRGLFSGASEETAILGAIAHGLGVVFVGFLAAYVSATLVSAISVVTIPGAPARIFRRIARDCITIRFPQTVSGLTVLHAKACPSRAPPRFCP